MARLSAESSSFLRPI